jgi:hypothetical protein
VQTCDTTTGGSDTGEGEGEGSGESANRTGGDGVNGEECGDAARARGATLSDHRWEGTNIEHDHRALFVANRRGKRWLWSGGARLDQPRIAWHVEMRFSGASACWLGARFTRRCSQVGTNGLGLTAQGAEGAEE